MHFLRWIIILLLFPSGKWPEMFFFFFFYWKNFYFSMSIFDRSIFFHKISSFPITQIFLPTPSSTLSEEAPSLHCNVYWVYHFFSLQFYGQEESLQHSGVRGSRLYLFLFMTVFCHIDAKVILNESQSY